MPFDRLIRALFIGALLLLAPGLVLMCRAQERIGSRLTASELVALLDSIVPAALEEDRIPGAAFILVQEGRVVLVRGYGVANMDRRIPVDPDSTIFPIASISKVFTATALMQLITADRAGLHDDVNKYLRRVRIPRTYDRAITPFHLLTHTAGLDELPGRLIPPGQAAVPLDSFLATRLVRVHPPGTITSYSSYAAALAGLLVEDLSGIGFEEYLSRAIWQPLHMSRTFITVPGHLHERLAVPYEVQGDSVIRVEDERYHTPPASSIRSTAADMGRFMIALLQEGQLDGARILPAGAVREMLRQHVTMHPKIPGWGLGFQADDANGLRIFEHGGDIAGFSSLMVLLPDQETGFFIVNHQEGHGLRFTVKSRLLDRFFPPAAAPSPPRIDTADAASVAHLAGTWRANAYCHTCAPNARRVQDFEVEANHDGTLTLWGTTWIQESPLFFRSADGRRRIGFHADSTGRITALTAGSWRVLERSGGESQPDPTR